MALRKLEFKSGKVQFLDERGRLKYQLDANGAPLAHDILLTPSERDEFHELRAAATERAAMNTALDMKADPRFKATTGYLRAVLTPEEAMAADTDPKYFLKVYEKAREQVGPSEREQRAEERRIDRIAELETKISEQRELRHGVDNVALVAELASLHEEGGEG